MSGIQERTLKDPPAYWAWNGRKAVLGTGETRLGPGPCGGREAMRAYNRRTREMDCVAERESERVVVLLELPDNTTGGEGRARTSSMHAMLGGASDECRYIG